MIYAGYIVIIITAFSPLRMCGIFPGSFKEQLRGALAPLLRLHEKMAVVDDKSKFYEDGSDPPHIDEEYSVVRLLFVLVVSSCLGVFLSIAAIVASSYQVLCFLIGRKRGSDVVNGLFVCWNSWLRVALC